MYTGRMEIKIHWREKEGRKKLYREKRENRYMLEREGKTGEMYRGRTDYKNML